jgi:hypothetical protein
MIKMVENAKIRIVVNVKCKRDEFGLLSAIFKICLLLRGLGPEPSEPEPQRITAPALEHCA